MRILLSRAVRASGMRNFPVKLSIDILSGRHNNERPPLNTIHGNMVQLTQADLEQLASQLDRAYAALIEEVRQELAASGEQHFQDLAGRVHDHGEESVADMLADLGAALIDRHILEMRDIEAAQRRMQDGAYGACVDCGADIGLARLKAYPTAQRCIECQGRQEKNFAQAGHPSL